MVAVPPSRETIGRVAGGAVALEVLRALGVEVYAYSKEIAGIVIDPKRADRSNISKSPLYMPDLEASAQAEDALIGVYCISRILQVV